MINMETKLLKKFEEMDADERKKLIKVLSESKNSDEMKQEKIDWIYKEEIVDREEYLLGRKIDSTITNEIIPETEDVNAPGALFQDVITRRSNLDMQIKMREDPLYAIRLKEEEARKRLLDNPLKLKKYQLMLEQKGKKQKVKKQKSDSSNEDSETDELLQKYLSIVNKKKNKRSKDINTNDKTNNKFENESYNKDFKDNHQENSSIKEKFKRNYNLTEDKSLNKHRHDRIYNDDEEPNYKHKRKDSQDTIENNISFKNTHYKNCGNKAKFDSIIEHDSANPILPNKKIKSHESSSDESKYSNVKNKKLKKREKIYSSEDDHYPDNSDSKNYNHHDIASYSNKYSDKDKYRSRNIRKTIRGDNYLQENDTNSFYENKSHKNSSQDKHNYQHLKDLKRTSPCAMYTKELNDKNLKKKLSNDKNYILDDDVSKIKNDEDNVRSTKYGLILPEGVIKSSLNDQKITTYISPFAKPDPKANQNNLKDKKRKLTVEEMELKRKEMMLNAQERDKERMNKIKSYKIEEEQEERRNMRERPDAAQFTKPMMLEHAAKSSIEDRIKRNIHNIQRCKLTSQNFTKK